MCSLLVLIVSCILSTSSDLPLDISYAFNSQNVVQPSLFLVNLVSDIPLPMVAIRCELLGNTPVSERTLLPLSFISVIRALDPAINFRFTCPNSGVLSSYATDFLRLLENSESPAVSEAFIDMSSFWLHSHVSLAAVPDLGGLLRGRLALPRLEKVFRLSFDLALCVGARPPSGEVWLRCMAAAHAVTEELSATVSFDDLIVTLWTVEAM